MPSLAISVLTFRRNDALAQLLPLLVQQAADAGVAANILVVDNDPAQGAREVVEQLAEPTIRYVSESTPGIAAGRNRALDETAEDLILFIDDDETPMAGWLAAMLATFEQYQPSAVVGPVIRQYEGALHPWVEAGGGLRDRARHATGTRVPIGATNNLLLDMRVIRRRGLRFDAAFGLSGGSDTLFTKELTKGGDTMVWCDEALVIDPVSADRTTRAWLMKRMFRLGNTWARVHVLTAGSPRAKLVMRARLCAGGAARVLVGAAQISLGAVRRSLADRASGTRLVLRGSGMVAGAVGYAYLEYRRAPADSAPRPAPEERAA